MSNQERAVNKVLERLSEMRAAFDPDERAALDEIVTGARTEAGAAEVTSHALEAGKAASKIAARTFQAVDYDPDERAYKVLL
jgi:hypothetical protein